MAEVRQCWDIMLGAQGKYLVASIYPHFLGGEDPVPEATAGYPCEAKPTCPAKGLLESKKVSSGVMKAS